MLLYIGKRLLQMIPILLVVAILVFSLMSFVPGDPVQIMLGPIATDLQIEEVRTQLGLNDPFFVRMLNFLGGLLRLDFGQSYQTRMPAGTELLARFPYTLVLSLCCVFCSVLIGVPIGIQCALRANKLTDRIWMFITMLGSSMPGFWLSLLLMLLFALKLKWLPSNGIGGPEYFILPVLSNSITHLANFARQTRSSMLEVIRSDFVSTAKSKGLSERDVIWKHALPNALIPIITIIGARMGFMLGGSTIMETIFSIPGLGSYLMNGINNRDYPVVQGCIIYIAFIFSIIMLVTDLVYAFVDPRIKAQYYRPKQKKKLAASES